MMLLTQLLEIPFTTFGAIEDVNIYHYRKPSTVKAPYAVWQEENDDSFYSDNGKSERSLNGILEYYTTVNNGIDPNLDVLEQALIDMGASWSLTGTQYEIDTNLIHYSWDWSVGHAKSNS